MELIKENGIYIFESTYENRDIPKGAGFWWHNNITCYRKNCAACKADIGKVWWTADPDKAAELIEYADSDVRQELEEIIAAKKVKKQQSRAKTSDLEIPVPVGLEYYPFQKAGIEFMTNQFSEDNGDLGVLLGDSLGLGKTIQTLGLINFAPDEFKKILIICPASLKINWQREAERWLVNEYKIQIINAGDKVNETADIWIINYDIVKRYDFQNMDIDLLIADECTFVKNSKAQRSKAVYALRSKYKLFL